MLPTHPSNRPLADELIRPGFPASGDAAGRAFRHWRKTIVHNFLNLQLFWLRYLKAALTGMDHVFHRPCLSLLLFRDPR